MKTIITLLMTIFLISFIAGYSQFKNYPNPSVAYIEKMGYKYELSKDLNGNEKAFCVLPDGSKVDGWEFLLGKSGKNYSYCAKKGYSTESRKIDHGTWTEEAAFCVRPASDGTREEIQMLDLMEKNGEPLVPQTDRPASTIPSELNTDPALYIPTTLPTSYDWRNYNGHSYIGPIRNQGSCGSCYAFGSLSSAESVYNFATGNYDGNCVDLSESFIIWCMGKIAPYNSHLFGCGGADLTYTELKTLVDSGVTYEANFPYVETDPGSCTHWNDPRIKFTNWYRVNCQDLDAIKTAIMTYGAVDACVLTTSAFNGYTGGVYVDNNTACMGAPCYYTNVNHSISLVGWDVDPVAGEYWILRNSWGTGWGEDGYMKIAMTSAAVSCEVAYVTYVAPSAPVAMTNPATGISGTGATLNGTVNAKGLSTTVTFEYGPTTSYGSTITGTPSPVNGSSNYSIYANLSGLTTNTTYHFRVKADNSLGTTYGSDLTFTTNQLPSATTNAATNVANNIATLNGTVNANGVTTTVTFQYGLSTSYGSTINGTPNTVTGSTDTPISANISGLAPGTLYHFRVKAVNSAGTTYGNDLTFTTTIPTCTDVYEPNNSLAQAASILTGVEIFALINPSTDVDWFKFSNTSSKKNIQVEMYNLPADYDLALYKANGTLLQTSSNGGRTPEKIIYNTSAVATYYVKVYGYNGYYNATNCYTLKVSLSNSSWKGNNGLDPSDEEIQSGLTVYPNPTTGMVTMDYSNLKEGKIVLKVFNMTGRQIITEELQADKGNNSFNLDLSSHTSGLYIIQLTNDSETLFRKIFLQK